MMEIRLSEAEDYPKIYEIYDWYVKNSTATFDWCSPNREAFNEYLKNIQRKYPVLVVREKGKLLGYAYATPFKDKDAYENVCELTIYLAEEATGMGIGKEVYETLFELLKKQNIIKVYACITHPNPASERFHERLGFSSCGRFERCGYKFGKPLSMLYMEKEISAPDGVPKRFIPWEELNRVKRNRIDAQARAVPVKKIEAEDHPHIIKEIEL